MGSHMRHVQQALFIGGMVTVAALGFAGAASADPAPGGYNGVVDTVSESGHGLEVGDDLDFFLNTDCGADCISFVAPKVNAQLHRSGGVWTGRSNGQSECDVTLVNDAAGMTVACGATTAHFNLVKKI